MSKGPDKLITVDGGGVNTDAVKTIGDNGKPQKVKPRKVYAIVFKGQTHIVSRGEYYPLKKEKDYFFLRNRRRLPPVPAM